MGTYTTNYNLFMPTIGEQGWGDLVNGNFTIIDTTMKGLDTRIGTLDTEITGVKNRVTTLEDNIPFDASGNIIGDLIGNASTATQLNAVVNVSPSDISHLLSSNMTTYCAYVPGVLYTGTIKAYKYNNYANGTMYTLSSNNTWSGIAINTTTPTTYTFSNAKCVIVASGNTSGNDLFFYLPLFS